MSLSSAAHIQPSLTQGERIIWQEAGESRLCLEKVQVIKDVVPISVSRGICVRNPEHAGTVFPAFLDQSGCDEENAGAAADATGSRRCKKNTLS